MYEILKAEFLAPDIKRFEIHAPRIAAKQRAGQFVILRLHDRGERIPLTVAGGDPARGSITLIVQGVGKTTMLMNRLEAGDHILNVVGPLGRASDIENFGHAVTVGGGVGSAIAYPITVALKKAGNRVTAIVGAREKELLILEDEFRAHSDELIVVTDDGSYGEKGLVTDPLRRLVDADTPPDYVLAIGPVPMMRAVAEVTRPKGIHTTVSLNSLMVDGTGMCGGCRVVVGDEARFACVDGPEFDAHQVDFRLLAQRNLAYRPTEKAALERYLLRAEEELARVREDCRLLARYEEVRRLDTAGA